MPVLWNTIKPGNLQQIIHLIKQDKLDINTRNEQGDSLLIRACETSAFDTAIWLIQQGADIHVRGKNKRNALLTLLEEPPLKNQRKQHYYLVDLLVSNHGLLNVKDAFGRTALELAGNEIYDCYCSSSSCIDGFDFESYQARRQHDTARYENA